MHQMLLPVDVISLCSSDGEIRPLRMRVSENGTERYCGYIREIIMEKKCSGIDTEACVFLCVAQIEERNVVVELKYLIRSHSWFLIRKHY